MKKNKLPYQQQQGFGVPEDYFGQLEENLLDMADGVEALNSGQLSGLRSSGFTTPDEYFDGLETEILQKTTKKSRLIALFNKEAYYYAAAVAAVFIALVSTLYLSPAPSGSWENIELSVLENYIEQDYIDMSTFEISSFIFEEGFFIDDSDFATLDSEATFEYLNENLEDPSSILE